MVAAPEPGATDPVVAATGRVADRVHRRRVVAVAVSPMELLRPESDLARLVEGFDHVDLLLAAEDGSVGVGPDDGVGPDEDDPDEDDEPDQRLRTDVDALGLSELYLHRLGLAAPWGPRAEGDLVAALSELVGFDPEPGVYCLAPAPTAGDPARAGDPGRAAVDRAAQRIARAYGIPLLRYRCLELAVVGEDAP